MPNYKPKASKPPASGEESGAALDAPSASAAPSNEGFGPNSRAAQERGPGGFRSSQSNPVPPIWKTGEPTDGGQ